MMSAEWGNAATMLEQIAAFINNSELGNQTITGETEEGDKIRITIRRARIDSESAEGGFSVRAYVATANGVYNMSLGLTVF